MTLRGSAALPGCPAVCHDILHFSAQVLAILADARPIVGGRSRSFSATPAFHRRFPRDVPKPRVLQPQTAHFSRLRSRICGSIRLPQGCEVVKQDDFQHVRVANPLRPSRHEFRVVVKALHDSSGYLALGVEPVQQLCVNWHLPSPHPTPHR